MADMNLDENMNLGASVPAQPAAGDPPAKAPAYVDPAIRQKVDNFPVRPAPAVPSDLPEVTLQEAAREDPPPTPAQKARDRRFQLKRLLIIAAVLLSMSVVAFLLPIRPTESQVEKRRLAAFPKFSTEALFSGAYFSDISAWFSDTVPFRDALINLNSKIQHLLGTGAALSGFNEGVKGDDIPEIPTGPAAPSERKTFGRVSNMRPGPASIATRPPSAAPAEANTTTTGIIMKPERIATKVSAATILTAAFGTESRRRM